MPGRSQAINEMPEVEFAAFLTGQYDALLLLRVGDIPGLGTFIIERLQTLPGLQQTNTTLILDEILKRPAVLPLSLPAS